MFNVLTRTNSRPNYFFLCYQSVKNQEEDVKHIVSVDCDETMDYLKYYDDIEIVRVEKTVKKSGNNFPYNSYLNIMNMQTKDSLNIILDDDDIFSHSNVLKKLKTYILTHDEDTIFLWKVKIGSRIVPSEINFKKKEIKRSDMSNIGFMYHSKHKNSIHWQTIRGGDFKAVMEISKKLKTVWIDEIFTQTNDNSGNFGNRKDKYFKKEEKENYEEFLKNYVFQIKEDSEEDGKEDEVDEEREDGKEDEVDEVDEEREDGTKLETGSLKEKEIVEKKIQDITVKETLMEENEKVYILKESTIKAIAEMLSSAIDSKILYENIINQNYLQNNNIVSSFENKKKDSCKKIPTITLNEHLHTEVIKSKTFNDSKETDELDKSKDLHDLQYSINGYFIMHKNISKDDLLFYYTNQGISKEKLYFFHYQDINFTIIDICQEALKYNYESILIIKEDCNAINNFTHELTLLQSNDKFKNCDMIICGQQNNFGSNKFKVKQKKLKTKKINNTDAVINMNSFDHDFYLSIYKDLDNKLFSSVEKSSEHYKHYGAKEGRYISRQYNQLKNLPKLSQINSMVLNKNAVECLSECQEPSILDTVIQKEFCDSCYEYSPYLFETKDSLKERVINESIYNYK